MSSAAAPPPLLTVDRLDKKFHIASGLFLLMHRAAHSLPNSSGGYDYMQLGILTAHSGGRGLKQGDRRQEHAGAGWRKGRAKRPENGISHKLHTITI